MQTVIEVLDFKQDSVNGQPFEKYKLKLMENNRVYITDGFRPLSEAHIKPYDVIDNMVIVRTLDSEERCQAFYRAQEIEKNIEKDNKVAQIKAEQRGTWLPGEFGQMITIDGHTGTFTSIAYTYRYLKDYTYFLSDKAGSIIHCFTGKQEEIKGIYKELALLPGYEGNIDRWFDYDKKASLLYIQYVDGKYEYRFTDEDYAPKAFYSEQLILERSIVSVSANRNKKIEEIKAKENKGIMPGQQDLFSMLL